MNPEISHHSAPKPEEAILTRGGLVSISDAIHINIKNLILVYNRGFFKFSPALKSGHKL